MFRSTVFSSICGFIRYLNFLYVDNKIFLEFAFEFFDFFVDFNIFY